ncbi:hypothetical protein NLU13_0106 [Sarocladium strictum]|uniref:Uncharacterized protein n=1 Tax=Sarocladium strictum TaxID=5046 RepID=A0AA39LAZ1_SARSR|nr:hypothetical protein NLU13_0106 [Sarocladium strictum]
MASFARALKSPSFLSPKRRPAMSGRTLSNSSDLSLASNHSGPSDEADFAFSAPGTPALLSPGEESSSNRQGNHDSIAVDPGCPPTSRPIAIELPPTKKQSSSSTYTPTAPLSGRGDLPGGYFPLHEDPTDRVHRTHPFHHDTKAPPHTVSAIPQAEHTDSRAPARLQPTLVAASQQSASTQISSYLPAGFHDHPLPLGKYYPSNYESRTNSTAQSNRPSSSNLMPPSSSSDSRITTRSSVSSSSATIQDSEVRRKLLQYQRDMVAQATMAATEVLGISTEGSTGSAALAQRNAALQELRLSAPASHKPISPRLLPLGSPGPVTPMELESAGTSYLDKAVVNGSPRTDVLASSSTG